MLAGGAQDLPRTRKLSGELLSALCQILSACLPAHRKEGAFALKTPSKQRM